jgi:predicted transposase YbfD/YdcC
MNGHFSELSDPRVERTKVYNLADLVILCICAVICGADDWISIARFAECKKEWWRQWGLFPDRTPSHDTLGRVFSLIDADEFSQLFTQWILSISELSQSKIIAVDGKTLRKSFDKSNGQAAIHMVSAWCVSNQCVFGQTKVDEKSNEITAIPKLLSMLDIRDCIVTTDAMGCQKKIVKQIVDQGGHYILALKGNHGIFEKKATDYVEHLKQRDFEGIEHDHHEEIHSDHGRIETRRTWSVPCDWYEDKAAWSDLKTLVIVESERIIGNKQTHERRLYISDLGYDQAQEFHQGVRNHWAVENNLHWQLDVTFNEDQSRIRKDHAPANMSLFRRIALNLLKREKTSKVGMKNKRLQAGWDEEYMLKVLGAI